MGNKKWFTGLVAAVFTPMHEDGRLNLPQVRPVVEHLLGQGLGGIFVCGSTGEGPSLSTEERRSVAAAYVEAVAGRLPVIVHVGHNSLAEAGDLARHAAEIGADAIGALPPSYFKPGSVEVLVECMSQIAAQAPDLPFYYYHLPALTGVNLDMASFLSLAAGRIPSLAGIKYSSLDVPGMQACLNHQAGRFNILFGVDEMLLGGLAAGAHGAVGSTYNFAAPIYRGVVDALAAADLVRARELQLRSVRMVATLATRYRIQPALKAMMKLVGADCGPARLPLVALTQDEVTSLERDMKELGFFDWISPQDR